MKDLTVAITNMSSREIAELTEKPHDNVLKTIRSLIDGGVVKATTPQEYIHPQNKQTYLEYLSDKRDSFVIVARLSPEFTARLVDRWQELEAQVVTPVAPMLPRTPTDLAVNHITAVMQLAALFEVPTHLAQVEAVKGARLTYQIDLTEILRLAPAQSMIRLEDEAVEPTELGKRLGLSAIKMNQWLEERGFQAKINSEWVPTDKGKPFAVRHQWVSGNKSGYNYKWKKSVLNA